MQELADTKAYIDQFKRWNQSIENLQAIAELLDLEPDQSLTNEAITSLKRSRTGAMGIRAAFSGRIRSQ
jgi:peptide chain release factor 2